MAEKKHSGKRKINYPVTTLSFKLGLQLFLRLLLAFLLMDLLLVSLIFYHWVDQQEKAAFERISDTNPRKSGILKPCLKGAMKDGTNF